MTDTPAPAIDREALNRERYVDALEIKALRQRIAELTRERDEARADAERLERVAMGGGDA
jgi:hypothetical protein